MPSENIFNTGLLTPKKNSKISRFTTDNDDIKHLHTPKVSPEKELKNNDEAFSNTSIPNAKTIKAWYLMRWIRMLQKNIIQIT